MQCTSSRKKELLDLRMFKQATGSKQSHTSLLLVNLKRNILPKIEDIISRLFHSHKASFFCQHLPNLIRQVKYILGRMQMCKNPKRIFSMGTWKFHKASVKFKWQISKLLKLLSFTFTGKNRVTKINYKIRIIHQKNPLSLCSPPLSPALSLFPSHSLFYSRHFHLQSQKKKYFREEFHAFFGGKIPQEFNNALQKQLVVGGLPC